MRKLLLASAAVLIGSGIAFAQSERRVTVNIGDIAPEVAAELEIEETNIPDSVELPIGVAASACGMDANELASDLNAGEASCTAVTNSQALSQVVRRQVSDLDDTETGSTNSARELAPGRSDNSPPGLTTDPQTNAPGQMKKCPVGQTC
jgi:hypothetical protein